MTDEERLDLLKKVDDSFWVLRIIGTSDVVYQALAQFLIAITGYPPLPTDHDGFSCGAHKCGECFHPNKTAILNASYFI